MRYIITYSTQATDFEKWLATITIEANTEAEAEEKAKKHEYYKIYADMDIKEA